MTFNDIKKFNEKFATLGLHTGKVEGIFSVSNKSDSKISTIKSGIVDFERSVSNQN